MKQVNANSCNLFLSNKPYFSIYLKGINVLWLLIIINICKAQNADSIIIHNKFLSKKDVINNMLTISNFDTLPFRLLPISRKKGVWPQKFNTVAGQVFKYEMPGVFEKKIGFDSIVLKNYVSYDCKSKDVVIVNNHKPFWSSSKMIFYENKIEKKRVDLIENLGVHFENFESTFGWPDFELYKNADCKNTRLVSEKYFENVEVLPCNNNFMLAVNRLFSCSGNLILDESEVLELYNNRGEVISKIVTPNSLYQHFLSADSKYLLTTYGGKQSIDPQSICDPVFKIYDTNTQKILFERHFLLTDGSPVVNEYDKSGNIVIMNQNDNNDKELYLIDLNQRSVLYKYFTSTEFELISRNFTKFTNISEFRNGELFNF